MTRGGHDLTTGAHALGDRVRPGQPDAVSVEAALKFGLEVDVLASAAPACSFSRDAEAIPGGVIPGMAVERAADTLNERHGSSTVSPSFEAT
jgi:hypothetical protein